MPGDIHHDRIVCIQVNILAQLPQVAVMRTILREWEVLVSQDETGDDLQMTLRKMMMMMKMTKNILHQGNCGNNYVLVVKEPFTVVKNCEYP